jgi:hypothetical protein
MTGGNDFQANSASLKVKCVSHVESIAEFRALPCSPPAIGSQLPVTEVFTTLRRLFPQSQYA